MIKKISILFLTVSFAIGCATTHPGQVGEQTSGQSLGLVVSAKPMSEYSDSTNVVIDFTFENKGTRWVRVDEVQLDFPNESGVIHNIIVGDDLKVWAESYANKKRRDNHNADLGLAGLVLTGLSIAVLGRELNNGGMASMGLAASGVGTLVKAENTLRTRQMQAQSSVMVPENYILAPMTVPSDGLLRRWVLVNLPNKLISKNILLTIKTVEGDVLKYKVPLVFKSSN